MTSNGATSTTVRVAVRLPLTSGRLGDWLSDAAAFDAAGADAIWLSIDDEAGLDPLGLLAALSSSTFRARLVLEVDDPTFPGPPHERLLETVRQLSHDRLTLLLANDRRASAANAGPAVGAVPVLIAGARFKGVGPDGLPAARVAAEGAGDADENERWLRVPVPRDRESWREIVAEAEGLGVSGVVVDAGPALLDVLRNPGRAGDRHDLFIAAG